MWAEEGAETVQRKSEDGGALLELSKYSATVNQKDFKLTVIEAALKASRHSSTNAMQCRWCSFDDDHRCRKYVPALSCRSRSKSPNLSTTTKYNKIQHTDKATTKKTKIQHQIEENKRKRRNSNKRRRRTVPAALPKCCSTFPAPSSGGTHGPRFVVPCH